jgi:hypothetical protein
MISVFTMRHRWRALADMLGRKFGAEDWCIPTPAQECNVVPPMLTAAIPVDAVIPRTDEGDPPRTRIISRRRTDFPVPAISQCVEVGQWV